MRFLAGTTTVSSAGSRVQLKNTIDPVISLLVRARVGNTGNVYFGADDVSSSNGLELEPGASEPINIREGNDGGFILFNAFYVDAATSGDKLDWTAIIG